MITLNKQTTCKIDFKEVYLTQDGYVVNDEKDINTNLLNALRAAFGDMTFDLVATAKTAKKIAVDENMVATPLHNTYSEVEEDDDDDEDDEDMDDEIEFTE